MHLTLSQLFPIYLDIALNIVVAVVFRRGVLRYTWRIVSDIGIARSVFTAVALVLISASNLMTQHWFNVSYFVFFYVGYLTITALMLKLYYQVYIRATLPFAGFAKWGKALFAWFVVIMAVMTVMTIGEVNAGQDFLAQAGINLMRAISTVEFCVAAFLCYLVRSMGMPIRSKIFGVMIALAIGDFAGILQSLMAQVHLPYSSFLGVVAQYGSPAIAALWIAYAYVPDPLPRPLTLPADSPVYRWSQIAATLGKSGTQVALPEPQHSFFLTDVERIVDRVFTRTMAGKESES